MQNTELFRRENLRKFINVNGGPTTVAKLLNISTSWLVQMTGPSPTRNVSERNARKYESLLGLEPMTLDTPTNDSYTPPQADSVTTTKFADTLEMVYHVATVNNITIDPKFIFLMRQALLVQKAEHRQPQMADLQPILDLIKVS